MLRILRAETPARLPKLAIAKGIVEAGGRISAESVPGEGASFAFTIPLAIADAAVAAEP